MRKLFVKVVLMNGTRLEELRELKDLKSKDLANILKVSKSTYSQWEHDKIPIPTKRIIQISHFYKINIDYIFHLTDLKKEINYESDIDLKEIGKHLKEIRLELGLTLRELGEKLNTAFSSLASYERGEVLIQSDILINLCKISNYSIDYVLGQSNDKYLKV